jgi:hypothetical protein
MAHPDPEPRPAAAAEDIEAEKTDQETSVAPEGEDEEPKPDPDKARRTVDRLMWSSAWLTVMVAVFLLIGLLRADDHFGAGAWIGAIVAILGLLTLIAAYGACALKRLTLRTRLTGPVDVFKASTVVMVLVVICGLLVPIDNTPALAVLLPWAVTYWLYGLDKTEAPAT